MRARLIIQIGLSVALTAAGLGSAVSSASAAAPACTVVAPATGATVSGTNVILSAGSSPEAVSVVYFLDGARLGAALPTGYGWLYTPDNGQTWGWDSTTVANRTYALTCVATTASGATATASPIQITVSNQMGCQIAAPNGSQPASGTRVAISAASEPVDKGFQAGAGCVAGRGWPHLCLG